MDIQKAVGGSPPPALIAQIGGGGSDFSANPGGPPVAFPPGLEHDVFRRVVTARDPMTKEQFDAKYPEPSFGPAVQDARNRATRLFYSITGRGEQIGGLLDAVGGEQLDQASDGVPPKPPLVIVFLDP